MEYNLEKITNNFTEIPIAAHCMRKIKAYASLASDIELYGFLLAPRESNDGIVRQVLLAKNQSTSGASGHLDGLAAGDSKEEIAAMGCKALGFWHSHANFGVFHSGTDDGNMDALYQAFAMNNEEKKTVERENFRYIDQEAGKIIYRIGGIEIALSLERSDEPCEKRYLAEETLNLADGSQLVMGITKDMRLLIKDLSVVIESGNVDNIQVKKYPGRDIMTLGAAYSIVVNNRGDEYGEIVVNRWCGVCEKQEATKYEKIKIGVIDDGPRVLDEEQLLRDIKERVNNRTGFFKELKSNLGGLKNLWPLHRDMTDNQE